MRTCSKCKQEKVENEFKEVKSGLTKFCKQCLERNQGLRKGPDACMVDDVVCVKTAEGPVSVNTVDNVHGVKTAEGPVSVNTVDDVNSVKTAIQSVIFVTL